jgi:hypothetical protein
MATNTWGGEEKYAYIEFPKGQKREINGRTIFLPSYYVKRGQDTNQRHQAVFLTPELAAQVAALYPDKPSEIHEEIRHTDDSTAPLPKELFEVGEILPAQAFEHAVKAALGSLSRSEVEDIFKRALS